MRRILQGDSLFVQLLVLLIVFCLSILGLVLRDLVYPSHAVIHGWMWVPCGSLGFAIGVIGCVGRAALLQRRWQDAQSHEATVMAVSVDPYIVVTTVLLTAHGKRHEATETLGRWHPWSLIPHHAGERKVAWLSERKPDEVLLLCDEDRAGTIQSRDDAQML